MIVQSCQAHPIISSVIGGLLLLIVIVILFGLFSIWANKSVRFQRWAKRQAEIKKYSEEHKDTSVAATSVPLKENGKETNIGDQHEGNILLHNVARGSVQISNIYFKCKCQNTLAVDETDVGATYTCPACNQPVQVPKPELNFRCACGNEMLVPKGMEGEKIQCVECKALMEVPAASSCQFPVKEAPQESLKHPANELARANIIDDEREVLKDCYQTIPQRSHPPPIPTNKPEYEYKSLKTTTIIGLILSISSMFVFIPAIPALIMGVHTLKRSSTYSNIKTMSIITITLSIAAIGTWMLSMLIYAMS